MSSPAVTVQPSLEDKILAAVADSEKVIAAFSPTIAGLVAAGVAVEPVISGMVKLVIGIFQHHTK